MSEQTIATKPTGRRGRPPGRGVARKHELMDRAAELMAERGFEGTSMRDIAGAVGLLPGSLYYHFPSKEDLLLAIHARVVAAMEDRVRLALESVSAPWDRLCAAARAHAAGLIETGNLTAILSPDFAHRSEDLAGQLVAHRHDYEAIFRQLFDDLPLQPQVDRTLLRLQLLGGLNWIPVWFKAEGGRDVDAVADGFVETLRLAYAAT